MADASSAGLDPEDSIHYNFAVDSDEWTAWTETVPRSTALDDRLRDLIREDTRAAQRVGDGGDMETASVGLLAQRIRIRAMQALGAVRDGDDIDRETAVDELEDVIDLADTLEG